MPQHPSRTVHLGKDTRYGVHDTFRHGLAQVRSDVTPGHPLQTALQSAAEASQRRRRPELGLAFDLCCAMDRAYLAQPRRLPTAPTPARPFALDVYDGALDTIDFADYLNDPEFSTDHVDVHTAMEQTLGL
ncbi:MAG: hypothetical protein SGCHY_005108 [Lobulomycetales sp.]